MMPRYSAPWSSAVCTSLPPAWLVCALLTMGALLGPLRAAAQFSGPTPTASPAANVPVKLTTDPAVLYPGQREIELGPGDQISVHLYESIDYSNAPLRLSLDGSVQLPLIGIVRLAGLSIHQAEALVGRRLIEAGMYRDPQVSIQLLESPNQIITVTGEVHAVVPSLGGNKRLLDVLAVAGGLPANASHLITINRPGLADPITVDLGPDPLHSAQANIPVYARDTVIVSRVGVVYVLGAFRNQGAIPLVQNSPLTLMQVAALGNGYGWEGELDDVQLVRTVGLRRSIVHVNLKKVLKGREPDPVLQTDDIVYLPSSSVRAAIKVGGINTLFGILSTIIFSVR
jgi:polysaccharide export outer membrane protein